MGDTPAGRAIVAVTDSRWYDFLRSTARDGRHDEVNFWRPLAQTEFKAVQPGDPFFFRLKHPVNAIAGYGFFAVATRLPVPLAWDAFRERNGDANYESFVSRIALYRRETPLETALGSKELTCLVLRGVRYFDEKEFIKWGDDQGWARNVVSFKGYDLTTSEGALLAALLRNGRPAELAAEEFEPIALDNRLVATASSIVREGQGSFRVRLLDAYDRRCAVTGEHSLPALEAAHIQPYLGPASNHLQNGLVLRADIHRLFDTGYVTVTPDYRFAVSRRLREEFANGMVYYELDGRPLRVLPDAIGERPSSAALEWHAKEVFK